MSLQPCGKLAQARRDALWRRTLTVVIVVDYFSVSISFADWPFTLLQYDFTDIISQTGLALVAASVS